MDRVDLSPELRLPELSDFNLSPAFYRAQLIKLGEIIGESIGVTDTKDISERRRQREVDFRMALVNGLIREGLLDRYSDERGYPTNLLLLSLIYSAMSAGNFWQKEPSLGLQIEGLVGLKEIELISAGSICDINFSAQDKYYLLAAAVIDEDLVYFEDPEERIDTRTRNPWWIRGGEVSTGVAFPLFVSAGAGNDADYLSAQIAQYLEVMSEQLAGVLPEVRVLRHLDMGEIDFGPFISNLTSGRSCLKSSERWPEEEEVG